MVRFSVLVASCNNGTQNNFEVLKFYQYNNKYTITVPQIYNYFACHSHDWQLGERKQAKGGNALVTSSCCCILVVTIIISHGVALA
jgi:hypothetical protein